MPIRARYIQYIQLVDSYIYLKLPELYVTKTRGFVFDAACYFWGYIFISGGFYVMCYIKLRLRAVIFYVITNTVDYQFKAS